MRHALLWLPGACIRRLSIALALIALACVSGSAFAYPASLGYAAISCGYTQSSPSASIVEACATIPSEAGRIYANNGMACTINNNILNWSPTGASGNTCVGNSSIFSVVTQTATTFPKNGGTVSTVYYCPNGGTLSGQTCTCPPPSTDTGSVFSQPAACPPGQFRELADSACIESCPFGQGNGYME